MYNDLLNRGYQKAQRGQLDSAIYELRKTIILDKLNPEGFYNLGGAYYQNKQYDKARYYWQECLKIKPDHVQAKAGCATIVTVTVPTPAQPQGLKN
jgi:tetratricopeptide (TPR) repeat protein